MCIYVHKRGGDEVMKRVYLIILCTMAKLLKLPIAGFEPRPFVDGIDCSTNCAISTITQPIQIFFHGLSSIPQKVFVKSPKD